MAQLIHTKLKEPFDYIINWYFRKNALPYWCIILLDSILCFISGVFVFWFYYDATEVSYDTLAVFRTLIYYLLINLVAFKIFHTYSGIIRFSSFIDLRRILQALALACVVAIVIRYPLSHYLADSFFVHVSIQQIALIYLLSLLGMCAVRVLIKNLYDVYTLSKNAKKALIYGMQSGGVGLAKLIRNEKPTRYNFRGFISDAPNVGDKFVMGYRVYSIDDKLPDVLKSLEISVVLVSPLKTDNFRNNTFLQNILIDAGIKMVIAEQTQEWDKSTTNNTVLNDVKIEDLLPRDEIQVDMDSLGSMLHGKTILITGSAGSIGSEMVRQIAIYNPAKMILIDQAETPQHDIRLMMSKLYPNIQAKTIVTSICKADRMETIFKQSKPDYVFHAAAYKHVPMMEDNPSESVQNNIEGTRIIADLSVKYGVKKFVMISTDKAVNPTNVMGCSKRICEIYVQSLDKVIKEKRLLITNEGLTYCDTPISDNQPKDGKLPITQFVTTRFGNVLGSNGSVIPLFTRQIKEGGPITVTDPNIIRYFMLIPEACKLVLEAGTKGKGGEIFVFDMGNPVKIVDLAKRMIYLSGAKNIEIKYTGLREGEKLYEEVLNTEETTKPSFHNKIRIAGVREYDYNEVCQDLHCLLKTSKSYNDMETVRIMKKIVPEFISNNSIYDVLDQ